MTTVEFNTERVREQVQRWVGPAELEPVEQGMNSRVWRVTAVDGTVYYAKVAASASLLAGLRGARHLAAHGFESGAPLHIVESGDTTLALLREVKGERLTWTDETLIGSTLHRAHDLLADLDDDPRDRHWPWEWPQPEAIPDVETRLATTEAVARAHDVAANTRHGFLHGDPAPEAFIRCGDEIGLIDWGDGLHGPPLYDVASAIMYSGAGVLDGYGGEFARGEVDAMLRYRFAVQAWYFADRLARNDLTGTDHAGNIKGYEDGRRMLLGGIEQSGRRWGAPPS